MHFTDEEWNWMMDDNYSWSIGAERRWIGEIDDIGQSEVVLGTSNSRDKDEMKLLL